MANVFVRLDQTIHTPEHRYQGAEVCLYFQFIYKDAATGTNGTLVFIFLLVLCNAGKYVGKCNLPVDTPVFSSNCFNKR